MCARALLGKAALARSLTRGPLGGVPRHGAAGNGGGTPENMARTLPVSASPTIQHIPRVHPLPRQGPQGRPRGTKAEVGTAAGGPGPAREAGSEVPEAGGAGPPVLPAPSGHKSGPWVRLNDSMSHPESQTPAGSLCVCTQPLPGGLASHVQTSLLRRSSPECPRGVRQLKSPPV